MRFFFALLICFLPTQLLAEELEAGRTYSGGTVVSVGERGVSITVPEGWQGALSEGYFVMTKQGTEGLLAVLVEQATAPQVQAFLSQQQQLPGGVTYLPEGRPERDGDGYVVSAKVSDGVQYFPAHVGAKTSENGWAIGVFSVIVAESARAETIAAGKETLTSAVLGKPALPEPGEFSGPWVSTLKNKSVVHRSSSDSSSDSSRFTFCGDGSFAYYSSQSGSSQTDFYDGGSVSASHQATDSAEGRWAISGDKIYLWANSGQQAQKIISKNDKGHLMLDGTRYFRDGDAC